MKYGVIPCAGQGKRMGFLSYILPKTLFPVWEKPLLHLIVENMLKLGVEKIFFIVNYKKEMVMDYVKRTKFSKDFSFEFIEQKELKGIAHAISLVEGSVNDDFICILGDDFSLANLQNLVDCFNNHDSFVVEGVVHEVDKEILKSTCCLKIGDKNQIIEIIEKPLSPISNLRGIGIYVFNPEIFRYIRDTPVSPKRNEVEITDTINLIAKSGKAYYEFLDGTNINVNSMKDLFKTWDLMRK